MTIKITKYYLGIILFLCMFQIASTDAYAQEAAARRKRMNNKETELADSLTKDTLIRARADSLVNVNKKNLEKLEPKAIQQLQSNSIQDSLELVKPKKQWIPNSGKATWYALVIPGGGQIYNRKYWKLPIIYGGFAGCAYALSWNNKMYKDYSQAYLFAAVSLAVAGTAAALTGQKVVKSGEHATLFQRSTYMRGACTAGPMPTPQITIQPRHGTVSIDRGTVKVKGGSCDGMSFPGVRVIYKSASGYHGPDVVAFETKAPIDTIGIRMMTETRVFELTVR